MLFYQIRYSRDQGKWKFLEKALSANVNDFQMYGVYISEEVRSCNKDGHYDQIVHAAFNMLLYVNDPPYFEWYTNQK